MVITIDGDYRQIADACEMIAKALAPVEPATRRSQVIQRNKAQREAIAARRASIYAAYKLCIGRPELAAEKSAFAAALAGKAPITDDLLCQAALLTPSNGRGDGARE